jgi:hypothetical protein
MFWNRSILKIVTALSIQFCSTAKAQVVFVETSEKNALKVVATSIAWGFLGGALLAGGLGIAFQTESDALLRLCIGGGTMLGLITGVYELKQENEKPPPAPALEFDQNGFSGFAIPVPRLDIERQTSKYLRSIEKRDLLRLRLNLVGVKF